MKTKQLLLSCVNAGSLLVVAVTAWADIPPMLPTPVPQQIIFQLSATDQWLSAFNNSNARTTEDATATDSPGNIRALLQQARETGDQRLLGQALYLLNQTQTPTTEIHLLRATTFQALHHFESALNELHKVLQQKPDNAQAWLMQASLHNVRGDYTAAYSACQQLLGKVPDLLSASCGSSVLARQGQAPRAYALLEQFYHQHSSTLNDPNILHHAQVTLAEIADQLDYPAAAEWWAIARASQPGNLYARIGAARNAWHRQAYADVISLTEHFNDVDALLLLRTFALQQLAQPEAILLKQQLAQRVDAARERGDTLHARDQAAILLDLLQRPNEALALAQQNWTQQREPEDTALLLRAALAAQRPDIYQNTLRWLQQWHQTHARYPNVPSPFFAKADAEQREAKP